MTSFADNNGCLDFDWQCENNPIFTGYLNSDVCDSDKKFTWGGGKFNGQYVVDTCKKSCGKCKFYLMFHSKYILNMKKQMHLKLISSATKKPKLI